MVDSRLNMVDGKELGLIQLLTTNYQLLKPEVSYA
jgi:hypothetical protein